MSESDNLDALSNVELRQKMIEQGLPNIPVTDSSRKVLVKRLRASLGGNASPLQSGGSAKKASRRETLASATKDKQDADASLNNASNVPGSTKARRTIAFTPTKATDNDQRRSQVSKVILTVQEPKVESVRKPAVSVTPNKPRGISETAAATRPNRGHVTIVEEDNNALLVDSLIVLESDDEEDEQLAQIARSVEKEYNLRENPNTKLSATTVISHEYISKPLPTATPAATQYSLDHPTRLLADNAKTVPSIYPQLGSIARQQLGPTGTSTVDYGSLSRSGRYSSYLGSSNQFTTAPAPAPSSNATTTYSSSVGASTLRRTPPRTYPNELSETETETDDPAVEFESNFVRNLARLRAERIGDRSSPHNRRTIATTSSITSNYEPARRRSLRPEPIYSRWWQTLDRKYNLKLKIFILVVILLVVAAYVIFQ